MRSSASNHNYQPPKWISKLTAAPRRLVHQTLELICPPTCPACRQGLLDHSHVLCDDCWQLFRESLQAHPCPMCGHDTGPYALIDGRCHRCQNHRPLVSRIVRVGPYQTVLRDLILAFKFRRQSHLDHFLGSLLADAITGDPEIRNADLFVPIPLHWRRRLARRYNQSELLAHAAARKLRDHQIAIAVNHDLRRIRHTPPQASLAHTQRLQNLHRAFAACRHTDYQQKHICLIDDVTTTGTTLRVAAHALKQAGAARISAAVLAVAAND